MAQVSKHLPGKSRSRVTVIQVDADGHEGEKATNKGMGNERENSNVGVDLFPAHLGADLEKLEIKTWSVEMALKPIIKTVTSLVSSRRNPSKRKGCSKKATTLVMAVEVATANFVEKGEAIAEEIAEARDDILAVVADVRIKGMALITASKNFGDDPCSKVKRSSMVTAARSLLAAVTRLLILADMVDVHILMEKVNRAQDDLAFVRATSNQPELMEGMRRLEQSVAELSQHAARRQRELKDPWLREELAAARAVLVRCFFLPWAKDLVFCKTIQ